jgi:biotin synthase
MLLPRGAVRRPRQTEDCVTEIDLRALFGDSSRRILYGPAAQNYQERSRVSKAFLPAASSGFFPGPSDLAATGREQQRLHEVARQATDGFFGRKVFVRAVVEVSNFCRQNCGYCGMRRENRSLGRFRADPNELAELLIERRPESVRDVNIQAGEDPVAVRQVVLPLVRTLRRETNLGISVCLGSLDKALYDDLRLAGANINILKFETADPLHYKELDSPGTLAQRIENIRYLAGSGWAVSSGFIAGLPNQGPERLLKNFQLAAELPLEGCSVSPFVPGDETPLASAPTPGADLALNCMAALRLMRPELVIPAVSALNLAEPGSGYRRGLRTGANLVTINMTPSSVRGDYLLYKRDRFIMTEEIILRAVAAEKLEPSELGLSSYLLARRAQLAVA